MEGRRRGRVVTGRVSAPPELLTEPEVFVNDYQVTRFPRDHGGARHFSLWVQYRGAGKWAVMRYRDMAPRMTYDLDGVEDYDGGPFDPDSDDDAYEKNRAWRERRRWDSAEAAIEFAKTLLPGLRCNGWTAEEVMRRDPAGDRT